MGKVQDADKNAEFCRDILPIFCRDSLGSLISGSYYIEKPLFGTFC